jgi:site-specific DNA recombinase
MPDRPRAFIYTRISIAQLKDTTKTDEQERLCRELCERRGWDVTAVFCDLSQSAWSRRRKRNDWDAMLEQFAAGAGDAIVTYWGDRLVRRPRDLEDLLDIVDDLLSEQRRRLLILASQGGEYNFGNPDHRMMMRWEVARACHESDTISRRKIQAYEAMARDGRVRPGGRRAFGFERDNFTVRPAEADIIRETAAALLAGRSAMSLARELTARGVTTTTGRPMSLTQMRRMITSPRVAGFMPDGQHRAAWNQILDESDWQAVRAVLAAKQPFHAQSGNTAKHLLSGIAACGTCQQALHAGHNAGGPAYRCTQPHKGRVSRSLPLLDAHVSGYVVGRLNSPASEQPDTQGAGTQGAELDALQRGRQATERIIEDIAGHPGEDISVLYKALKSYNSRIADLRDRAAASTAERLRRQYQGITLGEFRALPPDVQRSLVRATVTVTVKRASRRGAGFRTEDVVIGPPADMMHGGHGGGRGERDGDGSDAAGGAER